jgi:stage II sporulation protein D
MKMCFLVAVLACLAGSGCTRMAALSVMEAAPEMSEPTVRVLLGKDFDSVTVSCSRSYRMDAVRATGDTASFFSLTPMVIRRGGTGLLLIDRGWYILETDVKSLHVVPQSQGSQVRVNGTPYRGELHIRGEGAGKIAVVNRVGIEPYLFGVVPREIGFFSPDLVEAIKAQAVAARTYAFSHRGQYGTHDYDLVSDEMDQVYAGARVERPIVTTAVWSTRGEVLRYGGGFVMAYYHSTCGGRTEDITAVWNKPPEPYLVGADDDEYCAWSSYWNWEEVCTRAWLDSTVSVFIAGESADARGLGRLLDLRVERRRESGRVDLLDLVFENGTLGVSGDRSRWALARPSRHSPILPSANYTLVFDKSGPDWTRVTVHGHGYGHGVGMCQCGAIGRARAGQTHGEILQAYYTGVTLEKDY